MRKLPSLNALRAFEAVARLGGVQKASDELCVTHGAVSRHLKQLEQWLHVPLFDRGERALRLTSAGEGYRQTLTAALDLIQEGTTAVCSYRADNTLGVATTHSLAAKWLMKKLPDFSRLHPEVEVWLSLEQGLTDLARSGIDLTIRMGSGPWPEYDCIPLMSDRLVAVCSPLLLSSSNALAAPEDMLSFTLLHDQDPQVQWSRWFAAHQLECPAELVGPRFASTDILLSAAMSGQGIALVNEALAAEDLAAGRLVKPLSQAVELGTYYWIVLPKERQQQAKVQHFCHWLQQQAGPLR